MTLDCLEVGLDGLGFGSVGLDFGLNNDFAHLCCTCHISGVIPQAKYEPDNPPKFEDYPGVVSYL